MKLLAQANLERFRLIGKCSRLQKAATACVPHALPGLAGLLALALALASEWLLPAPGTTNGIAPGALPSVATGMPAAPVAQWGATALARPLFAPARRPGTAPGYTSGGLPRLSAIIVTGNSRVAIFSTKGQKPQLLGVGSEINGDKLLRVNADAVELQSPDGPLLVHPQFSTPAAGTASSMASPAPQAPAATPQGPTPGFTTTLKPLPPATPSSNPALYLEQNF